MFLALASTNENTPAEQGEYEPPNKDRAEDTAADAVTETVAKNAQPWIFPAFSVLALALLAGEQHPICGAGFVGVAEDSGKLLVGLKRERPVPYLPRRVCVLQNWYPGGESHYEAGSATLRLSSEGSVLATTASE